MLFQGIRKINFILILCLELNKAIHNSLEPFLDVIAGLRANN
ncbi:hypothetical protein EV13_0855 [Prochlorococcus sp. MIT 0702]|nr:hypothetical protein EV12_0632 [Prochlorococcus sp. MIT 0701]KGG29821.1 hypothetical protein EV13_0855 [Prochlorococcus sp. MIT 0702]KGG36403.1 hypothetical protein EV14_0317 [Prochlorococcus sp. MIT 0703]